MSETLTASLLGQTITQIILPTYNYLLLWKPVPSPPLFCFFFLILKIEEQKREKKLNSAQKSFHDAWY